MMPDSDYTTIRDSVDLTQSGSKVQIITVLVDLAWQSSPSDSPRIESAP